MLTEIKNEIKIILNSVDDIHNVYTEKSYIKDTKSFLNLFQAENVLGEKYITAWFVQRISTAESDFSTTENLREHKIRITGYLGIDENEFSSRKFDALLEDICLAFRGNNNLNGICLKISPMQINKIEEKYLGSVLCHYAELEITCVEKSGLII